MGEEGSQQRVKLSSQLGCGDGSSILLETTYSTSSEPSTQQKMELGYLHTTSHQFLVEHCSQGCSFPGASGLLCGAGRVVFSGFGEHPKTLRQRDSSLGNEKHGQYTCKE